MPGSAKCARGLELRKPLRKNICHKIIHLHLSRDHHPKIAFAAVRTVAVTEHLLLDLLSDAERKDLAWSTEAAAVEVLAETISENDPASTCYQAGLRDDIRKDGRRAIYHGDGIHVQHPRRFLAPTNRSWHRSHQDLRGSRIVH